MNELKQCRCWYYAFKNYNFYYYWLLLKCKNRLFDCCRQCCGPGMFIPDPKTATKERGEVKQSLLSYLFSSYKFHKIENYFIFDILKKKNWASFQRNVALFTQKFVTKLSKRWVWDLRSYSGSRIRA
jgi:hypothetical protein